jgi:hypothetical protein
LQGKDDAIAAGIAVTRLAGFCEEVDDVAMYERRGSMTARGMLAAGLAALAMHGAQAEGKLTVAVGGRGIGESCVTEIGRNAGLFAKHGLALEIVYTDGSGETQQRWSPTARRSASRRASGAS